MTTEARLGPALRELRKKNHWTLSEVSRKTGLSISTLSKAERNQLSLTYSKLVDLSEGLGVDITTFFESDASHPVSAGVPGCRSVNGVEDGKVIDTPIYQYTYLCADLLKKKFVPMVIDIRVRSLAEFGELSRHVGEEFAFVLEGAIEAHTENYAPRVLKPGECIYFDSGMAHAYIAKSAGRCRILSICSAPEAALMEAIRLHVGSTSAPASVGRSTALQKKKPAPRGRILRA